MELKMTICHGGKTQAILTTLKYPYVVHAEMNAIVNNNSRDLRGTTMYVTLFPCVNCTKLIIQTGITRVVYDSIVDEKSMIPQKTLFSLANVSVIKYQCTDTCVNFNV